MATSKPVVAVVGATGKQGSSVVKALLKSGKWTVRALARSEASAGAQQLKSLGAEVVATQPSDLEQLKQAFSGAYAAFLMTFETLSNVQTIAEGSDEEFESGRLQADAASAAGVKVVLFSTLEDSNSLTQGRFNAPHFTGKARVSQYITEKLPGLTAIYPSSAFFYSNFAEWFIPHKGEDGALTFALPLPADSKQPYADPTSALGSVTAALLESPEQYRNQVVPVIGEWLTATELVEKFTEVTGVPAGYYELSKEEWFSFPMPAALAEGIYNMFQYVREAGYYEQGRDLELGRKLVPDLLTWAEYLKLTGWKGEGSSAQT